MWQKMLMRHLAKRACPMAHEKAFKFVDQFSVLCRDMLKNNEEFLAVFLGVIKDLFLYVEENQDLFLNVKEKEVSDRLLSNFADESMGLFLLYIKYYQEQINYTADFKYFLRYKTLSDVLSYKGCNRLYRLCQIERTIFQNHAYKTSIDIKELTSVFNILLNELNNPLEIISDLLVFLKCLEGRDEEFDKFISSIKELLIIKKIYTQLYDYAQKSDKRLNDPFFCSPRRYRREVEEILARMDSKELQEVWHIMDCLHQIKIFNPNDKLLSIIDSLDAQYPKYTVECSELTL